MAPGRQITSRNARFQQWESLLANRKKRQHAHEFVVQGVRPISLAVRRGWPVRTLIYDGARQLSDWASDLLRATDAECVSMATDLLTDLGEKDEDVPELVAIVEMPADDLDRIEVDDDFLGVVLDRPSAPGNIGSIIRSADAFGANGVIVTGHAADVYDPKSVRASTGSLFAIPAVRMPSEQAVTDWVRRERARGQRIALVGADERGHCDIFDFDFTEPVLLLIGNEARGLSRAWRDACDYLVKIPMRGSATSLNAANAATTILYEASRQRMAAGKGRRQS